MSPDVARRVVRLFREFRPPEKARHQLTPQENELLKLIVEGHSYKTAAAKLDISISTVSFHLQNIYTKLQVHSKSEAVAKALHNKGWLDKGGVGHFTKQVRIEAKANPRRFFVVSADILTGDDAEHSDSDEK